MQKPRSAHWDDANTRIFSSPAKTTAFPQSNANSGPPAHFRHMLQWQALRLLLMASTFILTAPQRHVPCAVIFSSTVCPPNPKMCVCTPIDCRCGCSFSSKTASSGLRKTAACLWLLYQPSPIMNPFMPIKHPTEKMPRAGFAAPIIP